MLLLRLFFSEEKAVSRYAFLQLAILRQRIFALNWILELRSDKNRTQKQTKYDVRHESSISRYQAEHRKNLRKENTLFTETASM
jgi:hypothetical protein